MATPKASGKATGNGSAKATSKVKMAKQGPKPGPKLAQKSGKLPGKAAAAKDPKKTGPLASLATLKKNLMGGLRGSKPEKAAEKIKKHVDPKKAAVKHSAPKAAPKPAMPKVAAVGKEKSKAVPPKAQAHVSAPAKTHGKHAAPGKQGAKAAPAKGAAQAAAGASLAAEKPAKQKRGAAGKALRNGLGANGAMVDESVCREVACEGLATSIGYCRLHYIKNWKKIKRKEQILRDGKLNQYIEELVLKYPDKYIEAIRQDLANDKDFAKVIHDLDLDESIDEFDVEGESVDALIDNIRRDFDDEGETF